MTSDNSELGLRKAGLVAAWLVLAALTGGCRPATEGLEDGYYTAQAADYDERGWQEYLTIFVNGNTIVTVEFNARNASGFLRSWDLDYVRRIYRTTGVYPGKFVRAYAQALLNRQNPELITPIAGATAYHRPFQVLAEAAVEQARRGDRRVALVTLPEHGE